MYVILSQHFDFIGSTSNKTSFPNDANNEFVFVADFNRMAAIVENESEFQI